MPVDLHQALMAIAGEDGQLKTATEKLAHEPEDGHMDAGGTASGLGQMLGRGPMDAKAILDERALEQAGAELEGRTWGDPRERSGARNLATRAGPGPTQPTIISPLSKPSNTHLPRTGPATHRPDSLVSRKTAGISEIARAALTKTGANWNKVPSRGAQRFMTHAANKSGPVGAVARGVEKAKQTAKGLFGGKTSRTATYGHPANKIRQKGQQVAHHVGKNKGKYIAGAGAAAAGGAYVAGRKHKKEAGLTLAGFMEAQGAGEAGVKLATQAYGERDVFVRALQLRDAQSTGMKIACGMFQAARATNEG